MQKEREKIFTKKLCLCVCIYSHLISPCPLLLESSNSSSKWKYLKPNKENATKREEKKAKNIRFYWQAFNMFRHKQVILTGHLTVLSARVEEKKRKRKKRKWLTDPSKSHQDIYHPEDISINVESAKTKYLSEQSLFFGCVCVGGLKITLLQRIINMFWYLWGNSLFSKWLLYENRNQMRNQKTFIFSNK